ncbi:hypothetical protein [Hymenobacter elongatus]|uniref:Lipoprotein n=1 Tax=Hymenobacter elongatus TaxID=877208 RepID=A0A4Z0PNG9_9BACT|nr:hypothetical protein [Hymenobacter elongatus]TGE16770.1 hypothetical protein E5J99_08650 [Hymenobacter elongatus]
MPKSLSSALGLALLLCGACTSPDSKQPAQEPAATTPAAAAAPVSELQAQLADPQVGDVYVVRFQPRDAPQEHYFFYHLYRVGPDSAYLHPARKEASTADADLSQPDFQASDKTIIYTRAELAELQQQQPGDVLKTQLVGVRRKK